MNDTRIDVLFLSEPETVEAGVTDMSSCIEVISETLRLMSIGDTRMGGPNSDSHGLMMKFPDDPLFPTMPKNGPDRRFAAMPAYVGGEFQMAGMKWYGSNVDNKSKGLPRSIHTVILSDPDTGAPQAIMAGNLVSAYRTAAVPGVGAKYLAKEDAETVAVIGPGTVNTTSLEAFMTVRPGLKRFRVLGRSASSIEKYVSEARNAYPHLEEITVAKSVEETVEEADIVSVGAAVPRGSQNYPFIDGKWLKPGALVSLPAFTTISEDFLANHASKVVDSCSTFQHWAKSFPYPSHESVGFMGLQAADLIHDGKMTWDSLINLGDVISGEQGARESDDQVCLFSFGGLPIEDVSWATHVYRNALEQGIGISINYWPEPHLA